MSYEPQGIFTEGRTFDFGQEAGSGTDEPSKGKRKKSGPFMCCSECGERYQWEHKSSGGLYCSPECNYTAKRRITDERGKCLACHALVGMTATASGKMVGLGHATICIERKKRGIVGINQSKAVRIGRMRSWGRVELSGIGVNAESPTRWKNKLRNDAISSRIRGSLSSRLAGLVASKTEKTDDLIGCNSIQLRQYLESKFEKWMTWDNYGKRWHIDHILPCASFNHAIESHRRQCWHWTNLRPLCAIKNRAKSDKITLPQMSLLF